MVFGSDESIRQLKNDKRNEVLTEFAAMLETAFELVEGIPYDKNVGIDCKELTEILFDTIEMFFGTIYTTDFWEGLVLKMSNDEDVYEMMKSRLGEIEKELTE